MMISPHGYGSQKFYGMMTQKQTSKVKLYSLVALFLIFILYNNRFSMSQQDWYNPSESILTGTRKGMAGERAPGRGTKKEIFPMPQLTSLVLVACHSVYKATDYGHPEDVSSWSLLDYQKKTPGQTHSFVEHIQLGVKQAASDEKTMLLFSGGQTRKEAGPRAESMGYWLVAEANDWFGFRENVRHRAFTEEHSRDSLENIMFSLCRFYELTGAYPEKITVISYEFKEKRFVDVHRKAIKWPRARIAFVGTPTLDEKATVGEEHVRSLFEKDPYGCTGELAKKRKARDPFGNGGYNADRCPAMKPLLDMVRCEAPWTQGGSLPWSSHGAV